MERQINIKEYEQNIREFIQETLETGNDLTITDILETVKEWISYTKSYRSKMFLAIDENGNSVDPNADNAIGWSTLGVFEKINYLMEQEGSYYHNELIEQAKYAFVFGSLYNPKLKTDLELSDTYQKNTVEEVMYVGGMVDDLSKVLSGFDKAIKNTEGL